MSPSSMLFHIEFLMEELCILFPFWLPSFCFVSLRTDHRAQTISFLLNNK